MNDEGIGIAGWLFADLMLVLALVFVAVGREDDAQLDEERAAHSETQRALDEERAAHAETQDALDAERTASAEAQDALDEERAARTDAQDALDEERAARADAQDALDRTRACLVELNFRFDQIIVSSPNNEPSWETILDGRIRTGVTVAEMDKPFNDRDIDRRGVLDYLRYRKAEGFQIAVTQTFSFTGVPRDVSGSTALSKRINEIFFCSFAPQPAMCEGHAVETYEFRDFFVDGTEETWVERSDGYYSQNHLDANESRIGILFVKPPGEDCE